MAEEVIEKTGTEAAPEASAAAAADVSRETPAAETPAYEPNYSYRVKDQEAQFDDFLRESVKSKEQEDKLRDLYTRAGAFEDFKRGKEEASQNLQKLVGQIQKVNDYVGKGDMERAIRAIGLPEEKLLEYFAKKYEYEQLDPSQKKLHDDRREAELKAESSSEELNLLREQMNAMAVSQRTQELNSVLAKDGIRQIAEAFDKNAGHAGSFADAVKRQAIAVYHATGKDLSAEEAVEMIAKPLRGFVNSQGSTTTQGNAASDPERTVIVKNKNDKPVIPSLGRNVSAGKPSIRSIADLRKEAKKMTAQ